MSFKKFTLMPHPITCLIIFTITIIKKQHRFLKLENLALARPCGRDASFLQN
jgi:hypothetical protein